ncbi:hypothetical protein ABK040_009962 [Willaertia magna]
MEAPDINCMAMVGAIYKNNYYFIDSARNDGSLMRVNSTTNKIEEVISKTGIDKDIPNLIVVKDKFYYANKTSIISYDMINLSYWTYTPLTLVANIKAFAFDFSTQEIYVSECVELDNDRCAISMIVNGSNIYYIETSFSQNGINSTIVKLGKDGSKKLVIAGEGNSDNDYILAKDTKLYGPTSLVMTLREEIMFVEPSKNRIRKIKKDGKVLTLTMTGNELHNPNWIGLYDNNLLLTNQVELYVSDITLRSYDIKQMIQQIFNLNNNNFSYKWSQISGTNTLDLNTISIAGTDRINFCQNKANDNNLIQGETYGLQLNITRSEILNDASTNNPIQSSVVAGETNIKAIITNAQDAEGKAIEYAFGYFTSTNERVYLSYFSQSKNSATFKLPLFTSGKAKVFLTVRDKLLDIDEKIVELTVTDPTANLNDNQLNNYIQNLPVSNPNDPNIKQQREELRNTIVNSLVASPSSQNDTSTVLNILSRVTQNTQELKLETAITALQLTLNITNNNNQQQNDKIVALTSQLINSVLPT